MQTLAKLFWRVNFSLIFLSKLYEKSMPHKLFSIIIIEIIMNYFLWLIFLCGFVSGEGSLLRLDRVISMRHRLSQSERASEILTPKNFRKNEKKFLTLLEMIKAAGSFRIIRQKTSKLGHLRLTEVKIIKKS